MGMSSLSRRALLGVAGGATASVLGPAAAHASPAGAAGEVLSVPAFTGVAGLHVPKQYAVLRTLGYYEPGDEGGAQYRRLAAEPAQPDRWHVRSADGAWFEIAEDVVSVKALGAVGNYDEATGQGSDDTAALAAAARLDRVIYVPGTPLTYRTTEAIRLNRDGSTWYGDGYRSKITLYSIDTGAGQLLGISGDAPATADGPPRRPVRGVRVSGLHLDTRNTRNNNGLGGSFLSDVYLDNLYFSRIGRKAITFQYHCSNVHCEDIKIFGAAGEPGSTHSAISVEGQTQGVDLTYAGGVAYTHDLQGNDVSNISFVNVSCERSGYNYLVVSNAHRVRFENIDLGDTNGAGSFVNFVRQVWDCQVRSISGGDTRRRMIFFDAAVRNCSVEDFHFGVTEGTGADGRAIHCAGSHNSFRRGSFRHGNPVAAEAIFVTGRNNRLTELHVSECASAVVLNAPPAAEDLELSRSTFESATAGAFRVKGARALIDGNRFLVAGASRFEGPGNQCVSNYLAGADGARLVVTPGASAIVVSNTFDAGATVDFQGNSLYSSVCHSNTGVVGRHQNYLPLAGGAIHMDGAGVLRVKATRFESDTDGATLGG